MKYVLLVVNARSLCSAVNARCLVFERFIERMPSLVYSETQFGIFALCGVGNTVRD